MTKRMIGKGLDQPDAAAKRAAGLPVYLFVLFGIFYLIDDDDDDDGYLDPQARTKRIRKWMSEDEDEQRRREDEYLFLNNSLGMHGDVLDTRSISSLFFCE